uniref:Ig-like domain-containing protein n=1 Tax=Pseudonaja textilis TaxID=8673 RepID=A0A670ZRD9_PSETE
NFFIPSICCWRFFKLSPWKGLIIRKLSAPSSFSSTFHPLKRLRVNSSDVVSADPPVVTVTRRVEAEDEKETHICRVHGFYPRVVNASWMRDGEVWLQDTLHGSVAPNADATYHYWLSIQIDPKERGRYKCHVEHDGLQEPLDVALKDEGQQGEKGWVLWQAGGLWEKNLTPAVSRSYFMIRDLLKQSVYLCKFIDTLASQVSSWYLYRDVMRRPSHFLI